MALVTNFIFFDIILALFPLLYFLYRWYTNNDGYWEKRGIPDTKKEFIIQTLLGKAPQTEEVLDIYQKLSSKKYGGFYRFREPLLMIRDPKILHNIMVNDFYYFQDRGPPDVDSTSTRDPLSFNLFFLRGSVWRALRYKLLPTFSSGKLRGMFEQMSKSGDILLHKIEQLSEENADVESKSFIFEFTLDVIASCSFGIQFKPNTPEYKEFRTAALKIYTGGVLMAIRFALIFLFPKVIEVLGMGVFPKITSDYFLNLTKATSKYRKEQNIQRNDYFQLLMTLKDQEESGKDMALTVMNAGEDDALVKQMQVIERQNMPLTSNIKLFTEESVCANSFVFLLAGSESTSSTITLTLFELCRNPDIQRKLQQEVDSVLAKHNGCWNYEAIRDMTYLDQVVQEAQRMYPVLPMLTRECVHSYKVPDSDLVIEKGMVIAIPVIALHMDPQYYPDPEKFQPERFKGNNFKPSPVYLPFGDGPRICIGLRFSVMQVKTCVARIMSQFSVKLSPKTQLPLKFDPASVVPAVKGGMWLSFEKRKC